MTMQEIREQFPDTFLEIICYGAILGSQPSTMEELQQIEYEAKQWNDYVQSQIHEEEETGIVPISHIAETHTRCSSCGHIFQDAAVCPNCNTPINA